MRLLSIKIYQRLLTMKFAIRIFALSVVVAGAAAAAVTPKTTPAIPSHQSATASMPVPGCGPYMCPTDPNGN
jgi:P pilus assembly chaperone PapD